MFWRQFEAVYELYIRVQLTVATCGNVKGQESYLFGSGFTKIVTERLRNNIFGNFGEKKTDKLLTYLFNGFCACLCFQKRQKKLAQKKGIAFEKLLKVSTIVEDGIKKGSNIF